MAVIAVGTTNACKLQALEKTIAMYSKLAALKVQGMKVDTGVAEQPKSMDETTCGAKNRAEKAFAGIEGAAYGVGMESGLFRVDGKMFDVCAASFFDGDKHHVGYSCAWEVPPEVMAKIEAGLDLTAAYNACGIVNDPEIGEKLGVMGVMSGNRAASSTPSQ
eukprot:TRINITY_DN11850_c0_g1_i4.p1 TRINITY_DN11850_c0_g1~~TRINITY_DN11850_c0_g1_i4.p1  ORF type:complete len:162 (+),score=43.15 TRINITY_DN11850_c0_g1_i4:98-583(+)